MKITRAVGAFATGAIIAIAGVTFVASPAYAADSKDGVCPAVAKNRVIDVRYVVNGTTYLTLSDKAAMSSHVEVQFDIDPDCTDPVEVSLVAYRTPSEAFNPNTAHLHFIYDTDTGMFNPSTPESTPKYSLGVDLPPCYYEVDFVQGSIITTLGPAGSNNFYNAQNRYISGDTGGNVECTEVEGTTTIAPTTAAPTTEAPTTTAPDEVEGVVVTAGTPAAAVQGTQVEGAVLAATGSNYSVLLLLGGIALISGTVLVRSVRRRPAFQHSDR